MALAQAKIQTKTYTEEDYYDIPEDVRAELIRGQIYYMASPTREHQEILVFLFKKITRYIDEKRGDCKIYPAPFAVKLFDDKKTIVEPDLSVICDPSKLTERGCSGAPDWIIEIVSPSTSSHDYVRKLNLYLDAGVREYWIVNPMQRSIYVYFLEEDKFKAVTYTFEDEIQVGIYDDLDITLAGLDA
ncbi:MAG: Uma2 family endonuclease [Ruminococcus sp.]|nr:Uma2 family endonuclease [Ruminococcus sp.]